MGDKEADGAPFPAPKSQFLGQSLLQSRSSDPAKTEGEAGSLRMEVYDSRSFP
jgi:hypothetical protein